MEPILKSIPYLTTNSLLNLTLTTYDYYHPCSNQLYQHIVIAHGRLNQISRRNRHFDNRTFIDGVEIMIIAKLKVLVQSISVNPELVKQIKRVDVIGEFGGEVNEDIQVFLKSLNNDQCQINIQYPKFLKNLGGLKINPTILNHLEIEIEKFNPVVLPPNISKLSLKISQPSEIPSLPKSIKKLSIVLTCPYTHTSSEKIDYHILQYLQTERSFTYLCIIYNPPNDGIINDGFEGNYLRRIDMITEIVKATNSWDHFIDLILPDFLQVLSCYEQAMCNVMWNGCQCNHCFKYLKDLDDFIHCHKYFDQNLKYWKDLDNSIMISQLSQMFRNRYILQTNHFECLYHHNQPIFDIHQNFFSGIDFQCSKYHVDEGEYNELGEDKYFDTVLEPFVCQYRDLFKNLSVCIVHYLDGIIRSLIDLNRGNAESREIDFNDLNDGETIIKLRNLEINGFQFYFDVESNGTNYFTCYYEFLEHVHGVDNF